MKDPVEDSLWDNLSPIWKVLAVATMFLIIVVPAMLALVEVVQRSFK
jgi:hypothetical protein